MEKDWMGITTTTDENYFSDTTYQTKRDVLNLCFNPNLYFYGTKKKESKAFEMGKIFEDTCLLTPEEFAEKVLIKKKGQTKEENKWYVTELEFSVLEGMHRSFYDNGFSETYKDWQYQPVICDGFHKGKLDFLSNDNSLIIDLKTIDTIDNIQRQTEKYHYYFQKYFYCKIMENLGYKTDFQFFFVEKTFPHRMQIVSLSKNYDNYCRDIYSRAVENITDIQLLQNLVTTQTLEPTKWFGRD